jgi:hypothetical protein
MRSFEVMLACASNDQGKQQLFSSVPVEADRQRQQLNAVLRDLGATPTTPVTVLSDGAEGTRFLGETASPGPTRHVLDWFHLSMRVQHVTQTARSWPRGTQEDLQHGDLLAKTIDRIRWRLWHGRPQGALDLIAEILEELEMPKRQIQLTAVYIKKLTGVLRDLETYVSGQFNSIINYAAARRSGEPISTAQTESAVHRLLHRRMTAKQQMRWSPRGAHFMALLHGEFQERSLGFITRIMRFSWRNGRNPGDRPQGADVRHERNIRTRPHCSRPIDMRPAPSCRITPPTLRRSHAYCVGVSFVEA